MRVLGVSGSLRAGSHNTRLLHAAADLLPAGTQLVVYGGLKALPPFDADDEADPPAAANAWREAVMSADALLFATPEYNHSVPGHLKNAVDWASRPSADPALGNVPAGVVGTSTGMFGAVWAQAELRKALAAAGARVVDRELPIPSAAEAFADDGALADADTALALRELLADLVAEAQARHDRAEPAAR